MWSNDIVKKRLFFGEPISILKITIIVETMQTYETIKQMYTSLMVGTTIFCAPICAPITRLTLCYFIVEPKTWSPGNPVSNSRNTRHGLYYNHYRLSRGRWTPKTWRKSGNRPEKIGFKSFKGQHQSVSRSDWCVLLTKAIIVFCWILQTFLVSMFGFHNVCPGGFSLGGETLDRCLTVTAVRLLPGPTGASPGLLCCC